jgi:hypothetical protein
LQQRQIDILQQQPQLGNAGNNDIQNAMKCWQGQKKKQVDPRTHG